MKFLRIIYTIWGIFWFWAIFILLYPGFLLAIRIKRFKKYSCELNKIWAHVVYWACFMPVQVVWEFKPKKNQSYVYCPNHNSYLDIPLIAHSSPHFIAFMGKEELGKVPLFGYMFKNIHIPVNRKKLKSRYRAFEETKKRLAAGESVLLFPEGGINPNPPIPKKFKDGAFRVAIEEQKPIVPVTIPYHWIILHDTKNWMKWHRTKIIFHKPIETKKLTIEDLPTLREQVYQIIYKELKTYFPEDLKKIKS